MFRLEGAQVSDDFHAYAAAGGRLKAHDRSFSTTVSDGVLNIAFTGVTNGAEVNAIEIVPVYTDTTPEVAYTYRADGLRYTKTISGTAPITYTWDLNAGLPVVVQDGTYSYVYGLGLISQTDGSGNQSYFLGNALGSTEALTDGSGNVIASYKYDVFGAVRSSSGAGWSEYRFTGQQDDAALGMTYLRARYYDPGTGRFITKDPAGGVRGRPESFHAYAYAWNNSVNLTDSSGAVIDTILDLGFIAYDLYKLGTDNLFGECDNLGENLMALGADVGAALLPFATGAGLALRAGKAGKRIMQGTSGILVGTQSGRVVRIPQGWVGRISDNAKRIVFQRPGALGNADSIRIMEPTKQYPQGYVRYYNSHGQPLDVMGKPGDPASTHIPLDYAGDIPGWPK